MNSSTTSGDDYLQKIKKVGQAESIIQLYGSLPVILLILTLTAYFIKINRLQRFELTILACLFLKYVLHALYEVSAC